LLTTNRNKKRLGNLNKIIFNIKNVIKQYYLELIILLISSCIVLANIGRESLWLDEIFSALAVSKSTSLSAMFSDYLNTDVNPPLYYVLLFYWSKIVGVSDVALRLLSFLFTILGFLVSYIILKKNFYKRIALLYLSLSALTPGVLFFSQEMRSYALLYTLASLLTILYVIFIKRIDKNKHIERDLLLPYLIIGVLISYTHHYGTLLIFSISISAIAYSILRKQYKNAIYIFATSCIVAIFPIVWAIYQFYFQGVSSRLADFSTISFNIRGLITNYCTLFAVNKYGVILLIVLFIPFILKFQMFLFIVKRHIIILIPLVILFIVAYVFTIFTHKVDYRYFIVSIPIILLFIGFVFDSFYEKRTIFIYMYSFGLIILTSFKSFTYHKQDFKGAAEYIKKNDNLSVCSIPINNLSDGSFSKLGFISYYLGNQYNYISVGPLVQEDCDLIYIDTITNEVGIKKILKKYGISIPYEILNFNKVYIVIKKNEQNNSKN
tara:strand:- start:56297 stop:57775 length:1479 start_codon:yes stop_codon:yes gene_type:complete